MKNLPSIFVVDVQRTPVYLDDPSQTLNLEPSRGLGRYGPDAISMANPSVTNNTIHQPLLCEQPSYDLSWTRYQENIASEK